MVTKLKETFSPNYRNHQSGLPVPVAEARHEDTEGAASQREHRVAHARQNKDASGGPKYERKATGNASSPRRRVLRDPITNMVIDIAEQFSELFADYTQGGSGHLHGMSHSDVVYKLWRLDTTLLVAAAEINLQLNAYMKSLNLTCPLHYLDAGSAFQSHASYIYPFDDFAILLQELARFSEEAPEIYNELVAGYKSQVKHYGPDCIHPIRNPRPTNEEKISVRVLSNFKDIVNDFPHLEPSSEQYGALAWKVQQQLNGLGCLGTDHPLYVFISNMQVMTLKAAIHSKLNVLWTMCRDLSQSEEIGERHRKQHAEEERMRATYVPRGSLCSNGRCG